MIGVALFTYLPDTCSLKMENREILSSICGNKMNSIQTHDEITDLLH
jgi:hypothetical protein